MAEELYVERFLLKEVVRDRTGLPYSTIYKKIKAGTFPKSIRISPRLCAWREHDIVEWQRERIAEGAAR
jgi:prophage regulatory protein